MLVALAMPACAWLGLTGAASAPRPPPLCDASHDSATEAIAPPEGSFDVAFIPSFDHLWVAGETEAEARVVVGGMRATVSDERITWARDLFAAEVIAAMACDGGWLFVARDGARAMATSFTADLSAVDDELGACVAPSPEPADTSLRTALMDALLFRRPHWLMGHADAVLWSRVHVLLRGDDEHPFQLFHASDASLVQNVEDVHDCLPARWGDDFAMVCPGDTIIRDVRSETPPAVPLPAGLHPILLSDDGVHALAAGQCTADSDAPYCVLSNEGWLPLAAPVFGAPTWIAMHGPWVLATQQPVVGPPRLTLLHGESGESCTVAVAGNESMGDWRLSTTHWTRDGVIVALGTAAEDDAPVLLAGRPHGGLTALPLPPRARSVRLLDAERGVAAGSTVAGLWRTSDGGRTWSRISLPVDGALDSISLTTRVRDGQPLPTTDDHGGPTIECANGQCLVGERILVRGWDGSVTAEQRILTRD